MNSNSNQQHKNFLFIIVGAVFVFFFKVINQIKLLVKNDGLLFFLILLLTVCMALVIIGLGGLMIYILSSIFYSI